MLGKQLLGKLDVFSSVGGSRFFDEGRLWYATGNGPFGNHFCLRSFKMSTSPVAIATGKAKSGSHVRMKKLGRSISDSKIMTTENKDQVCRL